MNISELAAFAVSNNNSAGAGREPVYALSVEEARGRVRIKDGNKKPKEDGTQALTLTLGKITLSLDVIKARATRVNTSADKVEAFTVALQAAIDGGSFDEAIVEAQFKANPVNKPAPAPAIPAAPEGVDLDDLDDDGLE